MSTFASNRDGGLTDEEGHYRFQTNVWDGEVIGNGLEVTENSPLGMSVLVNGGDAKVPYLDYAYTVWIPDGSPETATITTADPTNPRIDRVVLYVDRGESPQQVNPNNPGIPKIEVVAGTPAAVPTRPSSGDVDTAVSNNPWIDLADVLVGDGVTQITDANITDTRIPITIDSDTLKVIRQNNTNNILEDGAKVLTGWGVMTNDTGNSIMNEDVTFDHTFDDLPIVVAISGGDASTSDYGDGGNVIEARIIAKATNITTTGFRMYLSTESSGNLFGSGFSFYQWFAIGK